MVRPYTHRTWLPMQSALTGSLQITLPKGLSALRWRCLLCMLWGHPPEKTLWFREMGTSGMSSQCSSCMCQHAQHKEAQSR